MKISAIIAAAGSGRRLGKEKNKILLNLGGRPVLSYSLDLLDLAPEIEEIIIVAAQGEEAVCGEIAAAYCRQTPYQVVSGGAERMYSVYNGLRSTDPQCSHVLIHDGARPFLSREILTRLLTCQFTDGAILALPLKETVKKVEGSLITETIPREQLYTAQTPQIFRRAALFSAYEQGLAQGFKATDDASLVERWGGAIEVVRGSEENIKITTPYDWQRVEEGMNRRMTRVGSGFDVHSFTPGRPLILGGVQIPYQLGLAGHSDADVATHALMDAILGALAQGDIGRHFPPSDPQYKDADSLELLRYIFRLMREANYQLVNADITIIAERPKMAPHIKSMGDNYARILAVDPACINVKATTTEKLGFVGREEGIAAQATVLLQHK